LSALFVKLPSALGEKYLVHESNLELILELLYLYLVGRDLRRERRVKLLINGVQIRELLSLGNLLIVCRLRNASCRHKQDRNQKNSC
jgi:hypothetical protein